MSQFSGPSQVEESLKPYRVLCLDGGGMRGLYTACILDKIVEMKAVHLGGKPGDLGKAFDLICGTSTGSILACALASGFGLKSVQDLYLKYGEQIFPDPFPRRQPAFREYWWAWKHRKATAGNGSVLSKALEEAFGDETLEQVYQRRHIALCIPAVRASTFKGVVFKTPHKDEFVRDRTLRLVDVVLASGAAPIYLPLHRLNQPKHFLDGETFIDGGLWANNPALVGLVEALQNAKSGQPIEILSVGTCDEPSGDPATNGNVSWGLKQWKVGIGIMEAALSAQANGHLNIVNLLAGALRKLGQEITVVRLKETNKSIDQYSAIGLDRADQRAIQTIRQLAQLDAEEAVSYMRNSVEDKNWDFVRDILKTLNPS